MPTISLLKSAKLLVTTGAIVDMLLFSNIDSDVFVSGVRFVKVGHDQTGNKSKEVCISAGAFHSPKILELLRIRSASLLKRHGIPVVTSNPNVSVNLQDQTGFSFETIDEVKAKDDLNRQAPRAIAAAMDSYTRNQSGELQPRTKRSSGCSSGTTKGSYQLL